MKAKTAGVGFEPLMRSVKDALSEPEESRTAWGRHALRRDAGRIAARLEELRRRFPGRPDLLERIGPSSHLLRLLEEERGPAVAFAGGIAR